MSAVVVLGEIIVPASNVTLEVKIPTRKITIGFYASVPV
jgi:hypothetical protein